MKKKEDSESKEQLLEKSPIVSQQRIIGILKNLKFNLVQLNFQNSLGKLEKTSEMSKLRKKIAQLETLLQEMKSVNEFGKDVNVKKLNLRK